MSDEVAPEGGKPVPEGLVWLRRSDLKDWEAVEAQAYLDAHQAGTEDIFDWSERHLRSCSGCSGGGGPGPVNYDYGDYFCRFSASVLLIHGFTTGVRVKDER